MKPFLAVFLPLLVAYAATLWWCGERWQGETFAHCWLVPPLAAFVVWARRARWRDSPRRLDRRGWWLLGPGLALHLAGAALMVDSWSAASLVLTVPGAAWLALGRERLRGLWPVLGLVLFVVPLPLYVEGRLAFELKEMAVGGGMALANALGAGVVRAGSDLRVVGQPGALYVADACGGLRSLLAMTTLAYCLAFFLGSADWRRRATLVVLAPVLAIAANTVRIALLCLLARWWGVPFAQGTGHDLANVGEWLALLGALLVVDLLLGRLPQRSARERAEPSPGPSASGPAADATVGAAPRLVATAVGLWLLAVPLLALSLYRPVPSTALRAARLPAQVADWTLVPRTATEEAAFEKNLPRWRELLGTADFVWRCYRNAAGREVYVVALFHDSNWKSVHPPRICIEGSNMDILVDDEVASEALGENVHAGRILARRRSDAARYLTLSVFGTGDWLGGGYWEFTRHHLPLALLRANQSGFLLRAEMRVRDGEAVAAVQAECTRFLQALVPQARERLR